MVPLCVIWIIEGGIQHSRVNLLNLGGVSKLKILIGDMDLPCCSYTECGVREESKSPSQGLLVGSLGG